MIHIRPAVSADSRQMAELLNEIIGIGGTTAYTAPVTPTQIADRVTQAGPGAAWHVAEGQDGQLLGYQCIEPHDGLPPEACDIGTFTKVGQTGLGIGSRLFEATRAAALDLGYDWINANIRADNESGLTYYQSRGFRDWKHEDGIQLGNGQFVTKVYKRFDLKD